MSEPDRITLDDIRRLRREAESSRREGNWCPPAHPGLPEQWQQDWYEWAGWLDGLADKIAALLPADPRLTADYFRLMDKIYEARSLAELERVARQAEHEYGASECWPDLNGTIQKIREDLAGDSARD